MEGTTKCWVCESSHRLEIEKLLGLKVGVRKIAKKYGCSKDQIFRHSKHLERSNVAPAGQELRQTELYESIRASRDTAQRKGDLKSVRVFTAQMLELEKAMAFDSAPAVQKGNGTFIPYRQNWAFKMLGYDFDRQLMARLPEGVVFLRTAMRADKVPLEIAGMASALLLFFENRDLPSNAMGDLIFKFAQDLADLDAAEGRSGVDMTKTREVDRDGNPIEVEEAQKQLGEGEPESGSEG